jgi:cytochrome c6
MKTKLRSALEPNSRSRRGLLLQLRGSAFRNLLATVLSMTTFMAATVSAGLGQPVNSSAASTYKTNCVSCHAADGRGSAVGKSLHAADFHSPQVQQQSDAQLTDVITHGRGNMPAFGNSLNKAQIEALVKYVRSFRSAK